MLGFGDGSNIYVDCLAMQITKLDLVMHLEKKSWNLLFG